MSDSCIADIQLRFLVALCFQRYADGMRMSVLAVGLAVSLSQFAFAQILFESRSSHIEGYSGYLGGSVEDSNSSLNLWESQVEHGGFGHQHSFLNADGAVCTYDVRGGYTEWGASQFSVTFVTTAAAQIDVDGDFEMVGSGNILVAWITLYDADTNELLLGDAVSSFHGSITVAAGRRLRFDSGAVAGDSNSIVGVATVSASYVPTPATLAIIGVLPLARRRRR